MKRRRAIQVALVAFLFLLTLSLRADGSIARNYDYAEAYRVYSGLLLSRYFTKGSGLPRYVIEAETAHVGYNLGESLFKDCFPKQSDLDLSDWQTLLDLKKQSQLSKGLEKRFDPKIRSVLVPRKQLDSETNENGVLWAGFRKRYPDFTGILSISSVGFDEQEDRALVYVSFVCGMLCGEARFFTLEKRGEKWEVIEPAASCFIMY
jgi:hypothetical protein